MPRAPKGGLTTASGKRYEGGEFTPDHGLFCGKKGAKRAARRDKAKAIGRYHEAVPAGTPGALMFQVYERDLERSHISDQIGVVVARTPIEAMMALGGKANYRN
jgi:hypothetical protein